jgi:NhaA family Na+:H+ antiporter
LGGFFYCGNLYFQCYDICMAQKQHHKSTQSVLHHFLQSEASGGIILMVVAAVALIVANSPLSSYYFNTLHAYLGGMSVLHWINDGLMAIFFLFVGLEIKREFIEGQLSTWGSRMLPGIAAAGGVVIPVMIYLFLNYAHPETIHGWAIPAATDIAFALGILSLLGSRVPTSLKIFLTALAIIDDVAAVVIIALFYTANLTIWALGGAVVVVAVLVVLNRLRVLNLVPYMFLGAILWYLVLQSGIHATIAGIALALTIPLKVVDDSEESPLHTLEHKLASWVPFFIIPVFGFANAGVSFIGMSPSILLEPLALGVAAGLFIGKQIGVFGTSAIAIHFGWVRMPEGANWGLLYGVALLCGVGFTMSLFISLLSFGTPHLQDIAKIGVLAGSLLSAVAGAAVLYVSGKRPVSGV